MSASKVRQYADLVRLAGAELFNSDGTYFCIGALIGIIELQYEKDPEFRKEFDAAFDHAKRESAANNPHFLALRR